MATVAAEINLLWTVETNKTLGFATKEDLMLGDILISKSLDLEGILDEAWMEVEAKLGTKYVTPIDRSQRLPHHTEQFLTRVHAYLATSITILGQGGSDPNSLTYSDYLRHRAYDLMEKVLEGSNLQGLSRDLTTDAGTDGRAYAPAVFVPDEQSAFSFWEDTVHGTTVTNPGARKVWRSTRTYIDPNA